MCDGLERKYVIRERGVKARQDAILLSGLNEGAKELSELVKPKIILTGDTSRD